MVSPFTVTGYCGPAAATGIAGPSGGSAEKPVGLVHIALADEQHEKEKAFRFPGERERVRLYATQAALDMVRRHFLRPPPAKA